MDIDWAAIGEALRAPFSVEDVEFKPGRGGSGALIYIDARAVQDRLDAVVGPGAWSFVWDVVIAEDLPGVKPDTKVQENLGTHLRTVRGTLAIHGVPKQEIGNASDIDPDKGAVSDALKRCAVMWGIGRYLYGLKVRDEREYTAWLNGSAPPAPQPTARPEPPRRQPTQPTPIRTESPLQARIGAALARQGLTLADLNARRAADHRPPWEELTASQQEQLTEHYEAKPAKSGAA